MYINRMITDQPSVHNVDCTCPLYIAYFMEKVISHSSFVDGTLILVVIVCHYVNVSVPIYFSQMTSAITLIIISSP